MNAKYVDTKTVRDEDARKPSIQNKINLCICGDLFENLRI